MALEMARLTTINQKHNPTILVSEIIRVEFLVFISFLYLSLPALKDPYSHLIEIASYKVSVSFFVCDLKNSN